MITFDDFPEVVTHIPVEEDGKPAIGELINGRKVIRVKAVSGMAVLKSIMEGKEANENVLYARHPIRPFVMWCVELE